MPSHSRLTAPVRQIRPLVEEFGVKGFKFHPSIQAFHPNDRLSCPLYEAIEEAGAIAVFHTGQTGIGAGAPGGGGIRLEYSNPMDVDDVAADFAAPPVKDEVRPKILKESAARLLGLDGR
ncbi:amidohydrolase family protein [Kitasatospora sp. NPDC088351]|uniref:amidohydrolase family protein n=1 Tax=Kitasatospora sp. NPDC088351 TaxID=3155180 RepID=UPI0034141E92